MVEIREEEGRVMVWEGDTGYGVLSVPTELLEKLTVDQYAQYYRGRQELIEMLRREGSELV